MWRVVAELEVFWCYRACWEALGSCMRWHKHGRRNGKIILTVRNVFSWPLSPMACKTRSDLRGVKAGLMRCDYRLGVCKGSMPKIPLASTMHGRQRSYYMSRMLLMAATRKQLRPW